MKSQLEKGTLIELEHSKSLKKFLKPGVSMKAVAKAIATDHLKEDKNYYKKLSLIEPGLKEKNPGFVVQKAQTPYLDNGKTRFNIRNVPGVYLIYKNSELVYVGFSASDVYKALYRHLQSWNDKHQQRITFKSEKGITVRMIYTNSGAKARKLEGALIIKHKPPLNINKYDGFITDESEKKLLKDLEEAKIHSVLNSEEDLPF